MGQVTRHQACWWLSIQLLILSTYFKKYFLFPHKSNITKMFFKRKMFRLYSRYIPGIITQQQNFNLWNTVILHPFDAQNLFYYRSFHRVYRHKLGEICTVTVQHLSCLRTKHIVCQFNNCAGWRSRKALTQWWSWWTSTVTTNTRTVYYTEHTFQRPAKWASDSHKARRDCD